MSEIDKYKGQKEKLANLCDEHGLSYRLRHDSYPITLSISPLQGMYEQLSMLENAEDGKGRISQDACKTIYLRDGEYSVQNVGTFTMPETLERKFLNIFKKLCAFWMQYYFRETIENNALRKGMMPVIDEDEDPEEAEAEDAEAEEEQLPDPADDAGENNDTPDEELIEQATQIVRMENKCAVSLLQRRLKLGYSLAARIIDLLEERGVVGPIGESGKREVLPADVPKEETAEG